MFRIQGEEPVTHHMLVFQYQSVYHIYKYATMLIDIQCVFEKKKKKKAITSPFIPGAESIKDTKYKSLLWNLQN